MKTVASLMIYRNAIHGHSGQPVFFKQWPPSSMKAVLETCERTCQLLIGPATQLLDMNLRVIKNHEEVQPGGVYVLRGQEALDPPPRFFHHHHTGETSLRQLTRAGHAAHVEIEAHGPSKECSTSDAPHGSPPWTSQQLSSPSHQGQKWQADHGVSLLLSNGGLGQRHQFHHFDTWTKALPARRGIDRRSMSSTL